MWFQIKGTIQAHGLNKAPKYHTLWSIYPCTLEAGHQNNFSSLLYFRSEHGALHLEAEWLSWWIAPLWLVITVPPNRYYRVWTWLWKVAKPVLQLFSHTSGWSGWEITLRSSLMLLRQPQPWHKASFRLHFCEQCCNETLDFTRIKYQETHILCWYFSWN